MSGSLPWHLLRPEWLWALLALPLLFVVWRVRRARANVWRETVDAHLLPHLLDVGSDRRLRYAIWFAALGYVLAVLALAGPSWRQTDQPLWQSRVPLVIAMDLSTSMSAADLPPTRLAQARAKLAMLLRERRAGQIGLVVFADDAFTVAPLTDDSANVALFIDALKPDIMPRDGQRADRAIAWSVQLLKRAGFARGDILLITDHGDDSSLRAAREATREGFHVSTLGLGSEAGAVYRRDDGLIARTQLDADSLRKLAAAGDGRYATLTREDKDLRALGVLNPGNAAAGSGKGKAGRIWEDQGYWLLPPLMLLALFAFRRRAMVAMLAVCAVLGPWNQARAVDWWQRADQAAHENMADGTRAYRAGDFTRATELYQRADNADGQYNLGNALAKSGQYQQAIKAYDEALRRQPGMADALANKRAVEALLKQQPKNQNAPKPSGQGGGGQNGAQQPSPPGQKPSQSPPQQTPPSNPQDRPSQSPPQPGQDTPAPDSPVDEQAQQRADAAQRERMQRELERAKAEKDGAAERRARAIAQETPEQRERRIGNESWLKRVPDEPGNLLKAKFKNENERRSRVTQGE